MIKIFFYIILFALITVVTVVSVWAVFKLWKMSTQFFSAVKQGVIAQYKHWQEPKPEKPKPHNIPFLTTARTQLTHIQTLRETIAPRWLVSLDQAIEATENLLVLCENMPEQAERVRRFFKVTLDSLEQLTLALHDIQADINATDSTEAMDNILMIRDEAIRNTSLLKRKRHFDFQVMMETIKQRHK
ncbi:MAG: hypothetical protein KAH22_05790 [Thiotrichaceae bacterium]|nr:hypothetical protein [Thiotrichaceae bacterium]